MMCQFIRRLFNPKIIKFVVIPTVAFAGVALTTDAPKLIPVLNLIVAALSLNVCVAFGPNIIEALFSDRPLDRTDYLALGIFNSWLALVLRTMWSLGWRWLGEPQWMTNTDLSSFVIYLAAYGAVFHLVAPGAVKESVPPLKWVKIGLWVAGAALIGMLFIYYSSALQERFRSWTTPNDTAPSPSRYIVPL